MSSSVAQCWSISFVSIFLHRAEWRSEWTLQKYRIPMCRCHISRSENNPSFCGLCLFQLAAHVLVWWGGISFSLIYSAVYVMWLYAVFSHVCVGWRGKVVLVIVLLLVNMNEVCYCIAISTIILYNNHPFTPMYHCTFGTFEYHCCHWKYPCHKVVVESSRVSGLGC